MAIDIFQSLKNCVYDLQRADAQGDATNLLI